MPTTPWPDDPDELLERALDAQDATTNRMWRHRVRGNTVGMIAARLDEPRRSIQLRPPVAEARLVAQVARQRGLTTAAYVRQCVATSLVEEHGIDPSAIPWWTRDGLLP